MNFFGIVLLVFFAVIGLCAFITGVISCIYRGTDELLLVVKDLTADNAEARIRSAIHMCRKNRHVRVICVCEENDPARDICALLQKEYPFLEMITSENFKNSV